MNKIESFYTCSCHKLPIHWRIDMIMSRNGKGIGLGEIKVKSISLKNVPDCLLNKDKYECGIKLSKHLGINEYVSILDGNKPRSLPFTLFLRCSDGDYYCDLTRLLEEEGNPTVSPAFTASNHSNDPRDTKAVVRIPTKHFTQF